METLRVPKVAENVEVVTVGRWYRKDWEEVAEGEILVELITEKATFQMESPCRGVLAFRGATSGSTVPTGFVLAVICDEEEKRAFSHAPFVEENERITAKWRAQKGTPAGGGQSGASRRTERGRVRATPAARRLARREGVNLQEALRATGVEVMTEEVLKRFIEENKGKEKKG